MRDRINLIDNLNMRGVVTLEMFDSRTGKLQNKIQKKNFIAAHNKKRWAISQRGTIMGGLPNKIRDAIYSRETISATDYFFNRILLTSDSLPEDPSEVLVRGKIIGAADIRGQTTSLSPIAGNLNLAESYVDRERIHLVADFPTDRGNGTFQSIGFVSVHDNVDTVTDQPLFGITGGERVVQVGEWNTSYRTLSTLMGRKIIFTRYSSSSSNIAVYQLDLDNLETAGITKLFDLNSVARTGLTNDGQYLYMTRENNNIYKYDLSGNLIDTITTTVPSMRGIYYDEDVDNFFVTSVSSQNTPIGGQYNSSVCEISNTPGTVGIVMEIIPFLSGTAVNWEISDRLPDGGFLFWWASSSSMELLVQNFDTQQAYRLYMATPSSANYNNYVLTDPQDPSILYRPLFNGTNTYALEKFYLGALNTRVLLPSPQIKNNTQTMKLTYDIYYTDWTKV